MNNTVYITDDGQQFNAEDVERRQKCDFCGELGTVNGELIDGDLPSVHGEGVNGDFANICRNCLIEGVDAEALNENIGDPEELQEEEVELS